MLGCSPVADAAAAPAPVFVVSEVLNASGGRTGCFLYRGTLACAAPRSRTPTPCCPWPSAHGASACGAAPACPAGMDESEAGADLAAYEGQQLTLYMAYEEASPKISRQRGGAARCAGGGGAPWRLALRDSEDDLIFLARGLPHQAVLDEQLRLGAWAPTLSIAFPSSEAARAWAAGLARVDVRPGSLADTPAASALVAHAAAAALAGAGASAFKTIAAAQGHSGTPVQSCPPSPGRTEASAVGGKRKAEAAGLATPLVQPRAFALITPSLTPTCSLDLA